MPDIHTTLPHRVTSAVSLRPWPSYTPQSRWRSLNPETAAPADPEGEGALPLVPFWGVPEKWWPPEKKRKKVSRRALAGCELTCEGCGVSGPTRCPRPSCGIPPAVASRARMPLHRQKVQDSVDKVRNENNEITFHYPGIRFDSESRCPRCPNPIPESGV
jgi:hypothetical protein